VLVPIFGGAAACLLLTATASLAALLWGRRPLPLRALRGIELGLVSSNALCALGLNYGFFRDQGLASLAVQDGVGMVLAPRTVTWVWVVPMIVYGILIPNTGRRCAAVVGGMALGAVALNLTRGLLESDVAPRVRAVSCCGFVTDVGL